MLDIACGTGRILLPCLQAGVDIEGLDLFEPMLRTLRAKAAALGLSPRLHQADMSDFSLPRRFRLVMIPFNAFIHNMTQEAQIRCLQLCREHLLPGGKLAFDTFFPSQEIVGMPDEDPRAGGRDSASRNRPADAHVRHAHASTASRKTQHSLNEVELVAADGSVQTIHRSECSSRYHLQARNGAAATRRRLRAMGNLRRLRRPPADSRERRDDRDGLERVNRLLRPDLAVPSSICS